MTTHPWPNHAAPGCHQCAVLDRCLAQVPMEERLIGAAWTWAERNGYRPTTNLGALQVTASKGRAGKVLALRGALARQVCARLIKWVRWRGAWGVF